MFQSGPMALSCDESGKSRRLYPLFLSLRVNYFLLELHAVQLLNFKPADEQYEEKSR